MAYTVNKTNSAASPNQYTVQDGVVNTQTDLSFVGKGYAGYGELIAENFLALMENFANSSAPTKPITGQLWYDTAESRLKIYTGTTFVPPGANVPVKCSRSLDTRRSLDRLGHRPAILLQWYFKCVGRPSKFNRKHKRIHIRFTF